MDKRWTLAIVTVLTVLLIYSFLSMVLKTDKKRSTHSRMYRDYSNYNKKSDKEDYYYNNKVYGSSARSLKIKRTIFNNFLPASVNSYNTFMEVVKKNSSGREKKKYNNPQYDKVVELSRKPLPELHMAISYFKKGEYEDCISKLNEALEKLDPMEMEKRIQIYGLLSECYIKLKNDDGYVQNKIRCIRIQRKLYKLLKETFPEREAILENPFFTTEEASTNLLRIKSTVAKLPDSPMVRDMVKKAELDLEVARAVAQ